MADQLKPGLSLPKRSLTSVDLKSWLLNHGGKLIGGFIDNVSELSLAKAYLLRIKTREGSTHLIVQPAVRIHYTNVNLDEFKRLTPGVARLRALVKGERIVGIRQVGFDRLAEIQLGSGSRLVIELLPRGELIVVDNLGLIKFSSEYKEMRDRKIAPGHPYSYPPLVEREPSEDECTRSPEALKGLPKEVLLEAKVRGGDLCSSIFAIMKEAVESPKGFIAYEGEKPVFFSPYEPTFAKSMGLRTETVGTFNDALDTYFSELFKESIVLADLKDVEEALSRLRSTLEKERLQAKEYLAKAQEVKRIADIAMAHRELLEKTLECVKLTVKTEGWGLVTEKCPSVIATKPSEGLVRVRVNEFEIELDIRQKVKDFIEGRYEEYKRLKAKYQSAMKHLEKLEEELAQRRIELERRRFEALATIRKVLWYERFVWSLTRHGLLVIAGRNAQQNESLVRKYLEDNDLFLHADVHGGAATILKVPRDAEPTEEDIADAARIAACFSRAWKEGYAAVDVFYARGDQVSKSPPPGEYLPRGAFMVYGRRGYVKGVPLQLAFGLEHYEHGIRFTIGSEESVSARGELLGFLYPGELRPIEVAEMLRRWARDKGYPYVPPRHEVERLLPGPSKIRFIV